MSYAEALDYEKIYWLEFNEHRQTTSFSPVPRILLLRRGREREEVI